MNRVSIKRDSGFRSRIIQSDSLDVEAQICAKWGQREDDNAMAAKWTGSCFGFALPRYESGFHYAPIFSPELAISSLPLWERWNLFYSNLWTVFQTSKLKRREYDITTTAINISSMATYLFIYFWETSQIYQWRVVGLVEGEIIGQSERATTLQKKFLFFSLLASFFILG